MHSSAVVGCGSGSKDFAGSHLSEQGRNTFLTLGSPDVSCELFS